MCSCPMHRQLQATQEVICNPSILKVMLSSKILALNTFGGTVQSFFLSNTQLKLVLKTIAYKFLQKAKRQVFT